MSYFTDKKTIPSIITEEHFLCVISEDEEGWLTQNWPLLRIHRLRK
jgi:hypothetical protein